MQRIRIQPFLFVIVAVAQLLFSAGEAHAQLSMTWYTVDGGGSVSSNGALSISGTSGQPDASNVVTGGSLTLTGGFWPGATIAIDCPADITHDNAVGVADLLSVIGTWGACPSPCPPRCASDISPISTGDCAVNVADLLMVISSWGPCP